MQTVIALSVIMLFLFIGEWVSTLSKAYIPSVFVTAVLFLIGYWTIVPKNVTTTATFTPAFTTMIQAALLVHMGTLMDFKTLLHQWRAVVIALCGVAGHGWWLVTFQLADGHCQCATVDRWYRSRLLDE
ncbi:hypothetical protein LNP15_04355 [Fructobacillus sp. M131]|nr:hypothetical protein [Fructobacillus cardui]MCK8627484.1 hypothetical protein [Fructobacillus cardui]